MIGTARSIPSAPQSHPQKRREAKTARLFILENRPVSKGVSRKPSMEVMKESNSRDGSHHAKRPELKERNHGQRDSHDDRSKIGNRIEHSGRKAPHRGLIDP